MCVTFESERAAAAEPASNLSPDAKQRQARVAEIAPPVLASDARVPYPTGGIGAAEVVLELVIDEAGAVRQVRVVSGVQPFADAAQEAARSFRFEPARRGDRPVAAKIRFLVAFEQEELPVSEDAVEPAPPGGTHVALGDAGEPAPEPVEITVVGERAPLSRKLERVEIRALPGAFGNPFNAIESLPGVTPTLSGAPYFYVRGSPPGNLGLFLDGIRLPTLFHVFAGPSVIHPALVESVDFYAGPYPARYGRYAGGVAAGTVRPASFELHGEASARAFDSAALIEVPLFGERASLTLAGRKAYANWIAHLFAPEIDVDYWDYQARFVTRITPRDRLTLFGFGARDTLTESRDERRVSLIDSEFHRVEVRYERELEHGRALISSVMGLDRSRLDEGRVKLSNTSLTLRAEAEQRLGEGVRLSGGLDAATARYRSSAGAIEDPEDRADYEKRFPVRVDRVLGGFVTLESAVARAIRLTTGVRSDVYASGNDVAAGFEPRVDVEYRLGDHVALLHGFGVAHQPPGNVLPLPGATPALDEGLQTAYQSSAGIRLALPEAISLELTLFQAALFDLSDGPGVSRLDNGDDSVDEDSRAIGSARGLELSIRRSLTKKLGGYLSYTLARTERFLGRVEGPALFDRRHVLSGALAYSFPAAVSAGLRGTFYSGIPADVAYVEAAKDPPRTPPFYRVDLRVEKRFRVGGEGAYVATVLEILNATANEEVLGKSCNAYTCREDAVGPIVIPSAGLEAVF